MSNEWPYERFAAKYDDLMKSSPYPSDAAVAEAADISGSMISRWRSGKARPSRESLNKLADAFGVTRLELWDAAGLVDPGTYEKLVVVAGSVITPTAQAMIDRRAAAQLEEIPAHFRKLARLYRHLSPKQRALVDAQVELFITWAESELPQNDPQDD